MRIGLIDVDGHNFPNLPLMKISAWHKNRGDSVDWYQPLLGSVVRLDKVYVSKVFSFTPDYKFYVNASEVISGGSGYCIDVVDGQEVYRAEKDGTLPEDVEHVYPDYSLYPELTNNTAYGFMSRGCPRGCAFCHVEAKEGKIAHKVADLSEFWKGQKNIVLLDPNPLACKDWRNILQQLIDSGANVDFSQGVDIRLMTPEQIEMLKQIKIKSIHFAWDRYEDKDKILPKFKMFKDLTGWNYRKMTVYILTGFDTTFEEDLERIYTLRDMGYSPYVMIYNKQENPNKDKLVSLQRWVNSRFAFAACKRFEDYDPAYRTLK